MGYGIYQGYNLLNREKKKIFKNYLKKEKFILEIKNRVLHLQPLFERVFKSEKQE